MKNRDLVVIACSTIVCFSTDAAAVGFALEHQSVSNMGYAFAGGAASAEDGSTIFWNPAGMTRLPGRQAVVGLNAIYGSARFRNEGTTSPAGPAFPITGGDGGFIALRSREVSRHSLQHVIAYLRAFLRYCHDRGLVRTGLDSIDAPRIYRGELPPRALPWKEVQKLLASIDRQSKAGWRDYCILHLIAHYGLRPSELVALRLDSIDWGTGLLHVHQRKTRSDLVLPLAAQTMELLRRYLKHERERQGRVHPELFLRARCPSGPIERTAIGDLFEKRAQEAGLDHLKSHAYRLRHSFAMRLLTRGVGVKAIGDVLGHRSLEGTCAYLRLDTAMLRDVALSVPRARPYAEVRHA